MKRPDNRDRQNMKHKIVGRTVAEIRKAVEGVIEEHRPDPDVEHPAVSLRHLMNLDSCSVEEKAALADTIYRLGQVSWKHIHTLERHKLGFETIPRRDVRVALPTHVGSDVKLMVFRFSGMKAMIGYREGGVFFPLWLDLDFTAYKH